jgi:eukaryotic-like serine/threonine-protein kinase
LKSRIFIPPPSRLEATADRHHSCRSTVVVRRSGGEQAVAWLEADLAASASALESATSRQRAAVLRRLGRWQVDPALAGLRDVPAVAAIPEPERRSLRDLWCRIDALRSKAAATAPQGHGASRNP